MTWPLLILGGLLALVLFWKINVWLVRHDSSGGWGGDPGGSL